MQELIRRLFRYFSIAPEGIDLHNLRFYMVSKFANTTGAVTHLFWIAAFMAMEVWPLVWINMLSAGILIINLWLIRNKQLLLAGISGVLVVIGHYSLAVFFLGTDAEFQFYILMVSLFPLIMPPGHEIIKHVLFAFCLVSFILLDVWLAGEAAQIVLDAGIIKALRLFNIGFSFVILGLWAMYFNYAMNRTERRLEEVNEETENLLHNILPRTIARRLKDDPHAIAEKYPAVSVVFADLVGFTELSVQTSPIELVDLLNTIFSRFDDLAEEHGIEKIKTIGDAYMAVAGLPEVAENHAERCAEMALGMLQAMEEFNQSVGTSLAIRVGIDSGAVVAGVIGKSKFSYDLWGDTVNTASRMESYSLPGKVQASDRTYELLKDKYHFESRGTIEVKGKGEMKTWFLEGRIEGLIEGPVARE